MSEAAQAPTRAGVDRDRVFEIEQFYYAEARLLDDRLFKQWLTLLTPDVRYTIPTRHTALPDPEARGEEGMYDPERELSQNLEAPYRDENILTLSVRADRSYKVNSWSDNPAPRTRRFVSNVFAEPAEAPNDYRVLNNFLLSYSRHGKDNFIYTGQRRDLLRRVEGDLRIAGREVILDWNVIVAPSLGLFF
ncbi:MAG: hypothetical protein JRH19_14250 [Deltaproteobacteria bacterium]|nr:hypothetical protein [Deltaproteobacteria bacterium]